MNRLVIKYKAGKFIHLIMISEIYRINPIYCYKKNRIKNISYYFLILLNKSGYKLKKIKYIINIILSI